MKDLRTIESVLKSYETPFLRELNEACNTYKVIGSSTDESPAWMIFAGVNDDKLQFVNSQRMQIKFNIDFIDLDDKNIFRYADQKIINDFFRELKYSFIHSQHPTIETPNRPKPIIKEPEPNKQEFIEVTRKEINYDQTAIDFLEKHGIQFSINFVKHGRHFNNDDEERDIYKAEFKRKNRSFSVMFGQSLNDSGLKLVTGGGREIKIPISDKERGEMLSNNKKLRMLIEQKVKFNLMAKDTIKKPIPPTAYSVLACLTKNDPGTFEDFCNEYGYDTDSKKAEKTYKTVSDEWLKVQSMFTDEEIEELQEIN